MYACGFFVCFVFRYECSACMPEYLKRASDSIIDGCEPPYSC